MAKPIYKNLTVQVLTAVLIGVIVGYLNPMLGTQLKPLGDAFIRLVTMVVGPIIFLTIVVGIVSMGDLKKVGRVGAKAILYFEIVTTLALVIGLLVANVLKPGVGIDTHGADASKIQQYVQAAEHRTFIDFVLNIIPDQIFGAFARGELLQVVFFAILFGMALTSLNMKGSALIKGLEQLTEVMFKIVAMIMRVAPLGALGAMAYTVGAFGIASLLSLAKLMACVYLTMAIFIFVVLGLICRLYGFRLWPYLRFIKEEILLALGTSSSESVLPRMIEKLELMGCGRAVVGMVIPAGYSFNMDGTSIYLSMAVVFIAQAFGVKMGFWGQAYMLAILMLTSKGAAGVTGAGFVTLAATLTATHQLPVEGLALLLGVDRFMSEARTITNLIGNGVATIVVSKMEGEFNQAQFEAAMAGHIRRRGIPMEAKADLLASAK
ncbi:MAG TPA: dicarboxylate/amino acid:cation symporter [Tepidisphaeraceae bacterium]|nr:dicarboxylate/amino acid:cation symporter [Tepidisphaeraceae bacterium]